MNRFASLLAGTLTTVLSGAAVAGVAASQGVFDSTSSPAQAVDTTAAEASPVEVAATAAATEAPQVAPRIVYVDKEPVVYTQDVKVPAAASASMGQSGETATPVATPSAPVPNSLAGTTAQKTDDAGHAVPTQNAGAPVGAPPQANPTNAFPVTPAAGSPAAASATTDPSTKGTGDREDRAGATRVEHEDEHSGGKHE